MRGITKAALTLTAAACTAAALAAAGAGPAAAKTYPPPSVHLQCAAAPVNGALHGSTCALASGQTTAPNNYAATIAAARVGAAANFPVTFTQTAGSLPPGLTMSTQSATSAVITGNPAKTGTFNFTIKAAVGSNTSTMTYQITVTGQGPPDQLLCSAANGSFLSSGVCALPDATVGVPYQQGQLVTQQFTFTIDPPLQITSAMPAGTAGVAYRHDLTAQGGAPPYTWSIFDNDPLPPGLSPGTTAPDFNNVLTGTPTQAGTFSFLIQVTDAQGHSVNGTVTVTINP